MDEPDKGAFNLGSAMTPGLNGGLAYVNKTLGGIHGHPIKVVMCDSDQTPSIEVNCANNFVSKGVVAVFDAYDTGFAAASPIVQRAGIPIFGVEAADNTDDRTPSNFFFGPPNEAFAVGPLTTWVSTRSTSRWSTSPRPSTASTWPSTRSPRSSG